MGQVGTMAGGRLYHHGRAGIHPGVRAGRTTVRACAGPGAIRACAI